MSSIPTKQIDGDVAVGRNVSAGGNAVVRGCVTIGHNLKVEGWLHAPNIKGACKGYFLSLTDLNDAYPAPADGDYAFVSKSGLPGPIYIAKNGVWTDSGKTGGPSLDSNDIDDLRKEVAEYSGSIDAIDKAQEKLRADFDTHVQNASKEIAAVKATADTAAAEVAIAKEQAAAAVSTANEANTTANEAKNAAQSANDKANAAKSEAETANTTAAAAAKSAAAAAETAAGAVTAINTLKTENTTDHAAIRKEAMDALAAHAAANDKAFADEASARKAVSDALKAHEKTDAADHAAIRKTLSDSLASAKQEQHDTLGISGIVAFDGFVGDVTDDASTAAPIVRDPKGKVQQGAATVHFSTADGVFLIKQDSSYYPIWDDDYLWQDRNQAPWVDKAYYNVNDGKLYKIGSDNQLHEIALTKLRDDTGILPCKVRTAAPPAEPTTGYPSDRNYTIWWSQTTKAFFAAVDYDPAVNGDAIEGCQYYPLSVCDEYYDYCSVTDSVGTQTAVPRADRIFRSGNDLWQYDKAAGEMVKLGDVTGKDLAIRNLVCDDATLQGDVEVTGYLEVENSLTVQNGLKVENSDITVAGGGIHVQGEAELGSVKTTGDITANGKVSGIVIHGDSATFCQGEEVKIDISGNISTEGSLTVSKGIEADSIVSRGGLTVGTSLAAPSGEISGDLLVGTLSVDSDITAENITANGNITAGNLTASTATLSDTTLSGDTTFDGGSVSVDSGSFAVASGVGFYSDNINAVHVDGRIDFIFHGIRQSLPTDYTAVAQSVPPKTRVDGSTYDIIYIRDKKRFVAVDDTAKTYAERFYDEEEYNIITNNKPTTARTDRTWRWGGKIYAWDAEFALKDPSNLLSAYMGDLICLNDSAKEAFIKSWNEAFYKGGRKFGEYNRETGYFEGNGLTDINYEQAKVIMKFVGLCQNPTTIIPKVDAGYTFGGLSSYWFDRDGEGKDSRCPRTFPPLIQGASGGRYRSDSLFDGNVGLQAVAFAGVGGVTGNVCTYKYCRNLRYVLNMTINDTQGGKTQMFSDCIALETVELKGLYQGTVSFEHSPKLSLDSIKFMLNNRETANNALTDETKKVTMTLHADVFAKLTDEIIALAQEKNFTLVSA